MHPVPLLRGESHVSRTQFEVESQAHGQRFNQRDAKGSHGWRYGTASCPVPDRYRLGDELTRWHCPKGVVLLPVVDMNVRLPFNVIWKKNNSSAVLQKFQAQVQTAKSSRPARDSPQRPPPTHRLSDRKT